MVCFSDKKINPEKIDNKLKNLQQYLIYINYEERKVTPPKDFLKALRKNKKALEKFKRSLFTHKKGFVQEILDAKKPETRSKRIHQIIRMLVN